MLDNGTQLLRIWQWKSSIVFSLLEVTNPHAGIIIVMLCASKVVAAHLRVSRPPQDLSVARICVVDLHIRGIEHFLADGTDSSILDFAQPGEVSELEWRETLTA